MEDKDEYGDEKKEGREGKIRAQEEKNRSASLSFPWTPLIIRHPQERRSFFLSFIPLSSSCVFPSGLLPSHSIFLFFPSLSFIAIRLLPLSPTKGSNLRKQIFLITFPFESRSWSLLFFLSSKERVGVVFARCRSRHVIVVSCDAWGRNSRMHCTNHWKKREMERDAGQEG